MSVRVVDRASGTPSTLRRTTVRYLDLFVGALVVFAVPATGPFAVICTLIVIAPVLQPPLHLGLHDLAARTVVTSTAS